MRQFIGIFFLIFITLIVNSQVVFCPPGAEWHYTFIFQNSSYNNERILYVRDSIIGNETIKVLKHKRFGKWESIGPISSLTLIKQKGDTIFFRNAVTQHSWQVLYNFGALPGDQWRNDICVSNSNPTSQTSGYTVTVISVTSTLVNSFPLRQLTVQYSSSLFPNENIVITDRFGSNQFMFNFYFQGINHIQFEKFLCYQDSSFGLKQFTDKPCNYTDYAGLQENEYQNSTVKIYPNPAKDFFQVKSESVLENKESVLSIQDLSGRTIKIKALNDLDVRPVKVDLSDLAQGIYILSLSNNNELVYTGKFVKSD